ncbi:type I glyceraldehyde-3-phosphate dehydrogenase [Marinobacter sp. HL-58]|uniref:type I glyceraldehyde-3-phosphate dehydrogenase n=1 Tax=Marinobacter sp. HL-58 TaxID=1479237 RepID=UPI0006DA456F|nr:type I glyceraldehyde-3-phosphate dehydrogenase [Marinobacter sp. HL-58]KPP98883.1 MAG: glyceraldehyde 3-phosphate dehydrogenase [Marinobacter sp. HL-58]
MMKKIAINGLGRIGRMALRIIMDEPELEVVAVNDLTPLDNLVYLLRYDSVYGRYHKEVRSSDGYLEVDGQPVRAFSNGDPSTLPWRELDVDLVLECTGAFRTQSDLEKHIKAGARRVILSAPGKGGNIPSVVYGVNELEDGAPACFSTASCTTNCIAPVVEILHRHIGIQKAMLTTVHAYTASQGIVDMPGKNMERGRTAGLNIIVTTTGAASATGDVLPEHKGRFDGAAVRVPVATGSLSDLTLVTGRKTTVEEVNNIFIQEAQTSRYQGVLGIAEDPIVSSDTIGDPRAAIVDIRSTRVVDGDLIKVFAWYDNEWGYASQMVKQAIKTLASGT